MELFNLLEQAIPVFGKTYDVSLNWIGTLIRLLIDGIGVVGVGIIVFSLILKLVVLPFDVYQRISMRKQNLKMKEQQDRMEKLQKQYANDKEMYNQKLMEMYKENGISMFSSCLPMILSMVIFIVAINGFNAYAQFSAIENYNHMITAYKTEIRTYCPDLDDDNITIDTVNNKIVVKGTAEDTEAYIYYRLPNNNYTTQTPVADVRAYVETQIEADAITEYIVDEEKVKANVDLMSQVKALIPEGENPAEEKVLLKAMHDYFINKAQDAVVVDYEENVAVKTNFLWIKNIWVTDAMYKNPVYDYTTFEAEAKREDFRVGDKKLSFSEIGSTGTLAYSEDAYNIVTAKLEAHKSEANGYFILIALSIGTILLQQFVSMRSQKEQQKYSTVDGQGASQQKMMMIMMTGMFAIFSFMYSSAFSIYMITSNIFSLASTLIINKIVDSKVEKTEKTKTVARMDNRTLSRIEAAKNAGKASAQSTREKKTSKDDE